MKLIHLFAFAALSTCTATACGPYGLDLPSLFVRDALSEDKERSALAITDLRGFGEEGLRALLNASDELKTSPRFSSVVDRVAKQRDALRSQLFWHTNFEDAKVAAETSGRPILSLRLLGQLDEEFSCANSRLFREVLYADPEVADYLRENFVMHWKSVRPVPVMTIDFGDGRTLKRTITGNSAHYVLDPAGRVIDALPGLYSADVFLEKLTTAKTFAAEHGGDGGWSRLAAKMEFHQAAIEKIDKELTERLRLSGITDKAAPVEAGDLNNAQWAALAAVRPRKVEAELAAIAANEIAIGKGKMETPLVAEMRESVLAEKKRADLARSTAEDTVRNEFVLHRRIHERLAIKSEDVDTLNDWVYAELFKMPASDQWLGLHTPEVFTGLENNGIVSAR